jgi:hypothetical protein
MDGYRNRASIAAGETIRPGWKKRRRGSFSLRVPPTTDLRPDLLVDRAERPTGLERNPAEVLVLGPEYDRLAVRARPRGSRRCGRHAGGVTVQNEIRSAREAIRTPEHLRDKALNLAPLT